MISHEGTRLDPDEDVVEESEETPKRATTHTPPSHGDVERAIMVFVGREMHGQALGLMMSAYGERLARFFARRTSRHDLIEDLTQETFVRAMQGLKNFRGESRVITWLTRIAYNVMHTAHDRQNRNAARQARYKNDQEAASSHPGKPMQSKDRPDRQFRRQELARAIDGCLDRMSAVVRELALLVWVEGHTFVEAAEITDMSEEAVRKRLFRARPLLQRCLQGKGVVSANA